jgi:trigger factor
MGSKYERIEKNKAKLEFEIESSLVEQELQAAYLKTAHKYNIPGFRRGKAPRKIIEARFGDMVFFEDAFDTLFPRVYEEALEEYKIDPIERPKIEIVKIEKGENLVVTAEVTVKPEVELGQYKGLEAEKVEHNVTDDEVATEIERARDRAARYIDSEEPVKEGDRVTIDYSGSVDGVKFEGGTATDQMLEIGSKTFIPGFEEQVIGLKKDEEKAIDVVFPEDYRAEELKGKAAKFDIKVKDIKTKQLPELDDEFAKDVSEHETLDQLREDIKKRMQETADKQAKSYMEEMVIAKAVENAKVEIPDKMVDNQLEYMLHDMEYDLSMRGISLKQYFDYIQSDEDSFKKQYRDEAYNRVKSRLVLEAISIAENVSVSDEEYEGEVDKLAQSAGKAPEAYKESIGEKESEYIKHQLTVNKTITLLTENSIIVQPKEKKKVKKKTEEGNSPVSDET